MEIFIILTVVIQSIGVSLGVGSSTLAIVNYFVTKKDGVVDAAERQMSKTIYTVLRVAMGIILATALIHTAIGYREFGLEYLSPFVVSLWLLIIVLFANAVLMTKHLMPYTVGPALQAATWYSLGILFSLASIGFYNVPLMYFSIGYCVMILLALAVVNTINASLAK